MRVVDRPLENGSDADGIFAAVAGWNLDGSAHIVLKALHSMRFEIAIFGGIVVLWAFGALSRMRVRKEMKEDSPQAKKNRNVADAGQDLFHFDVPEAPRTLQVAAHGVRGSGIGFLLDNDPILHGRPNAARLGDPVWLIPRLAQLCAEPEEQSRRSLDQLKMAMKVAGLDFAQVFVSVVKLCTAKHNFQECLAIYDVVADDLAPLPVDRSLWSCLLFCAMESRHYSRCNALFERLQSTGGASVKDYWNMIRYGSVHGDWRSMLRLLQEMRTRKLEVDNVIYNTVMATCVASDQIATARTLLEEMHAAEGVTDVITYNTLMKGYARSANMDECFSIYELMCERGLQPSQVTYGILLDGCICNNRVDRAAQVFDIMTKEGCPLNTVLYTTLIKGFARDGKVDEAMRVYEQMNEDSNVSPDLITFSILLKANCDCGRLEVALELLGVVLRSGLTPDEVIFNNLLSGCAKQGSPVLAKRIYNDMVASGIRPSNATFSILIRLYSQCNLLEEATEMLQTDPKKYNVEVEARLFSQLIHCCIRARQGRRALEVYEMMCKQSIPNAAMHSSMLSMCVKLNMFETALELLESIGQNGARVNYRDAMQVVEGARRKKKGSLAESCLGAINAMGLREESPPTAQQGRLSPPLFDVSTA